MKKILLFLLILIIISSSIVVADEGITTTIEQYAQGIVNLSGWNETTSPHDIASMAMGATSWGNANSHIEGGQNTYSEHNQQSGTINQEQKPVEFKDNEVNFSDNGQLTFDVDPVMAAAIESLR